LDIMANKKTKLVKEDSWSKRVADAKKSLTKEENDFIVAMVKKYSQANKKR